VGGFGIAAVAVLLWWAERKRPLRRTVEPARIHQARNLAIAGLAAMTVQLAERPLVEPLAAVVQRRGWGVVPRLPGPQWLRTAAALLLLDYTLYLWHVLVHRVPALWRFHAVHHVDRDLDASTALRFHFGELTISVPWRALQVALTGVSPAQLQLWQRLVLVSILFHHSNLELPRRLERILSLVVMTPRLHGIHHSDVRVIRDSNWSSGLTVWDRLHGTLRNDLPQAAITIGVEGFARPADVTLPRVLALPFTADFSAPASDRQKP
jgi:sterol desaturase/sphingolipid hydroxylase (fatty acid hydroxylase superfamily)